MNKEVEKLLNEQVNKEFFSAYQYLSFANYFVDKGLNGFANWYMIQTQEERDHTMLFIKYMQNNDIPVTYEAVAKPEDKFADDMAVLKAGLAHEKYITDSINKIYRAAMEANDYRTAQFLDWFVKEQGEEETNANDLLKKMELFGGDPKGLYLLDQELAGRIYTAPSLQL
ncbi:MAG: ferritin [Eubacteriales bacterium]